jgi:L-amino acid N-acyltransferase YncA
MLKIRRAVRNDARDILLVRREAILSKAARHYDRATLNAWAAREPPLARAEQEIIDPALIVLVAEAEDHIIGFVLASPTNNELRRPLR